MCTHAIYSQGLKVKSFCLSAKINLHLTCNGPEPKTCCQTCSLARSWSLKSSRPGERNKRQGRRGSLLGRHCRLNAKVAKFRKYLLGRIMQLNAKISLIRWLRLIELAINGQVERGNVQRATCSVQRAPNIIKYQFKLTQQQFKPTAAATTTATTTATNTRRLAEKIKLVQKCKHVVCRMLHVRMHVCAYNEEGDSPDM